MNSNRSNNMEVKRISLIPSRQQQENTEYKYLPPIKTHEEHSDPKWQEFKIDGKNIEHRAYASIVIHTNYLYLYGGYHNSTGIMSDFYRMDLNALTYSWQKLEYTLNPGPRTRHSMCAFGDRLFLFGGQIQQSVSTNSLWSYDINLHQWSKAKQNQSYPPDIDNFASVLVNDIWYIFGGFFGGTIALHSNYIYSYTFATNQWLHLQVTSSLAPTPRDGSGLAYYNENLYIFAGSNGSQRFNDLWKFDLNKILWTYIPINSPSLPKVRSGHSFLTYNSRFLVFGGIHDITWELDDCYAFDIKKIQWVPIDEDSARRKETQTQIPPDQSGRPSKQNFRRPTRKTTRSNSIRKTMKRQPASPGKDLSEDSLESPTRNLSLAQSNQKTLEEKKRKELVQKKNAMLKLFEVDDKDRMKFRDESPTSEAMRNSILLVGNPKADLKIREGKLTEFGKPLISRFLQPLQSSQNTIIGKRPCARDGHSCAIYQNQLIIFGGDRHKMSFNDIHILDLSKI